MSFAGFPRVEAAFGKTWKDELDPAGLDLDGTTDLAFCSSDPSVFQLTGKIEGRVWCGATDWTPASEQPLFEVWDGGGRNQYKLALTTASEFKWYWSTDGTDSNSETSAGQITMDPFTNGAPSHVAVTFDPATGDTDYYIVSAGRWDAPAALSDWTAYGAQQSSGASSIHAGSSQLKIGDGFIGTVHEVELWDGLQSAAGTLVANPRFHDTTQWANGDAASPAGYGGSTAAFNAASPFLFSLEDLGVTQALVLPGQSGDYASAPSTNLLDADSAHLHQSIGGWVNNARAINIQQSTDLTPLFGDNHGEFETQVGVDASVRLPNGVNGIPVSASTQYTEIAYVACDTASRVGILQILWYDAGGGLISADWTGASPTSLSTSAFTKITLTSTSPGTAAFGVIAIHYDVDGGGSIGGGEKVYFEQVSQAAGASTTWLPSLNIVGDLDLRARLAPSDGTPAAISYLLSHRNGTDSWSWDLATDGDLELNWYESTVIQTGAVAAGLSQNAAKSVRSVLDVDGGAGGIGQVEAFDSDDTNLTTASWGSLGTADDGAAPAVIDTGSTGVTIGAVTDGGGSDLLGALLAFQVRDGDGGPIVLSSDFTDSAEWTAGGTTSTTDEGHTVTITQGSGGAVAQVSDRSAFWGTGSEYLSVLDVDALDFALTDDLALAAGFRRSKAVTGALIAKKAGSGVDTGWSLFGWNDSNVYMRVGDGTNGPYDTQAIVLDTYTVVAGERDTTADDIEAFKDGTGSGSPNSDTTTGTSANALNVLIGAHNPPGVTHVYEGEIMWAALFRRILTAAEHTELGGWDGTIANEPSWLRTAATLYVNAADTEQADSYISGNRIHTLGSEVDDAQSNSWVLVADAAIGGDWTDLTSYLTGSMAWQRGRQHETALHQAGTAQITLLNTDRRFEPDYDGGAHSPDIVPWVPIRIREQYGGISELVWTGFVEGWAVTYPKSGHLSHAVVRCADAFRMFNRHQVSNYEAAVTVDTPLGWWKLQETSGTVATDSGSAGDDGTYVAGGDITQLDAPAAAAGSSLVYAVGAGTDRGLVVCVNQEGAAPKPVTPTVDYGGQAMSEVADVVDTTGGTNRMTVFYLGEVGIAAASTTTITVALSTSPYIMAGSFEHADASTPHIVDSDEQGNTPNPITSVSVTPDHAGSAIVAFGQASSATRTAAWANVTEKLDAQAAGMTNTWAHEIVADMSAVNPQCTWSGNPTQQIIIGIVVTSTGQLPQLQQDGAFGAQPGGPPFSVDFDDDDHNAVNIGVLTGSDVEADFTVECWMNADSGDDTSIQFMVQIEEDASDTLGVYYSRPSNLVGFSVTETSGSPQRATALDLPVTEDAWHHVVMAVNYSEKTATPYVDGQAGAPLNLSFWDQTRTTGTMTVDISKDADDLLHFDGRLSHVAIYAGMLSASRVRAHYAASLSEFAAETYDTRITNVLTSVGWGHGENLETGLSTLTAITSISSDALTAIRRAARSENGAVFMGKDGRIRGWSRHTLILDSEVSQFTIGTGSMRSVKPEMDSDLLYNQTKVTTAASVVAVSEDTTSMDKYGPAELAVTTVDIGETDAGNLGDALLSQYKDPTYRIEEVVFNPESSAAVLWPALRDRDLGDRFTVTFTPLGGGAAASWDLIIEHIRVAHTTRGTAVKIRASAAEMTDFWVLDSATQSLLGTSTVLAAY